MPSISTKPNRFYPSIPAIAKDTATLAAVLNVIKEAVETHERRNNNYLKSFIRFEELVDLGIIDSSGEFISAEINDLTVAVVWDDIPIANVPRDFEDNLLQRPDIQDYGITSTTPSISSGAITFDFANGNAFEVLLTENITIITLSNPPASGIYGEIIIKFVQDGTGSRTVAGWPATVNWPGGTAPVITTDLTTGTDVIVLKTWDAGTDYFGDFSQDYS